MASGSRAPEQPEPTGDALTVGRAAALVGISVRTLHHWDTTGLVRPSGRTWSGYRMYAPADIARIHRVLVYRELGLSLARITELLDDPDADAGAHLRRQRSELVERIARLEGMVGAVDRMLEVSSKGIQLTPEQQVEIFGDQWRASWLEEAEHRWGDSAQWAQWADRTGEWTLADWTRMTADTEDLNADLAAAKREGLVPGAAAANALAERHRALMSQYFDCTHAMQVCMGRMFTDEPGYADYYDALEPGLTEWFRAVIAANARAHGVDPDTATWE
ncbi:MerR family transcriptional regulator [Nocardia crassostreae]|uniref:MerR family transcriptional regulator n=1 Tax=Nocardia crassostreae TaxID=53428 RepID=UPI0008352F80|nr:MerR family transcriptional regulator [Nocardia crassostreae]